uniref:Isoform 3 of Solute carrier family 35 member F4 n=1 Tax=Mus musculus TaxID=10090 RepID=Q8BZK4-3|nr:unnamed protein product [Mus musculus]
MDVKAAPNGVATIEDRILRITGYYGYYPGYSSQKSTTRSSVTRCKPGPNCPSSHSSISRQLSPLSVTEDSSAPILELQSRGSSGVCGRRVERQSRSGDDGTQTRPESSSQENGLKARCLSCTSMVLKTIWGLLIILSVSSSWVGTTQIVKITYKNFYCPFFMTWFSTNWNIMFFPVYYSGHLATAQEKQSPIKKFRECSRIFGEDGLTLKLFLKRTAPFSILWTLTNYLYLLALKKLTATDVSALFCCNKAFVFLLSWIVLKDRFMGVRVMAHLIPCAVPPCFLNLITALLFPGVSLKLAPLVLSTNCNWKMC